MLKYECDKCKVQRDTSSGTNLPSDWGYWRRWDLCPVCWPSLQETLKAADKERDQKVEAWFKEK